MSSASTTRTVKFVTKSGTYTATIMCPGGDIYQDWEGTESEVTKVYPNFATAKPKMYFVCTSSRVAEGLATPDRIEVFFGNSENPIQFSESTKLSLAPYAGVFKKIVPAAGVSDYFGVEIQKNLVELAGFAPVVITIKGYMSYGTQTDDIQAACKIPIQKSTGSSYRVTIAAGDGNNFAIRQKNGSCVLRAMTYLSVSEVTTGLSYRWQKLTTGTWQDVSGATSQNLTVSESSINTYAEYRVIVSRNGNEIGSDIQGVMDATDPYDIDPHPDPADETIQESGTADHVTYTPEIVSRGTNARAMDSQFYFVVKDAAGVILNPSNSATAKASHTVTRADCVQAGGDVSITISSVQ